MDRKYLISAALIALSLLMVVAALTLQGQEVLATSADHSANQVTIDNFTFAPQTLTVKAGTKVTWQNHDDIPHTVASSDNKFRSKALDTNDEFSFTFTEPGTYEYFCSLHPRMTGKIIVE